MIRTGNNVFKVKAETIFLDLLTDSGTGALSDRGWAEIMAADERYAHSATYEKFIPIAQEVFDLRYVLPVHQGRAAENIACTVLLSEMVRRRAEQGKKVVCLGNTYFDTTFFNASRQGARVINSPCREALDTDTYYPFKGNADIEQMRALIEEHGPENIGFIVMTVVNNAIGGQPVSLANLKAAHQLAKEHNILFILDAARMFENAYFIKKREEEYRDRSIQEIVHEMTALADLIWMSAKKDAIANMGGLLATNNEDIYRQITPLCILIEGHYSYGGMSGRDLAALALGLREGLAEDYLRSRINQVEEFGNGFRRLGFPIQWPPGSNGIFLDARGFLSHVDPRFFPAQRLCAEIYERYGIRPVEIGLSLAGRDENGVKIMPPTDLVRFTVPRRVFSSDHLDFILGALNELYDERENIGGMVYNVEGLGNGHFTSTFTRVNLQEIPALVSDVEKDFNTPKLTLSGGYLPPNAGQ